MFTLLLRLLLIVVKHHLSSSTSSLPKDHLMPTSSKPTSFPLSNSTIGSAEIRKNEDVVNVQSIKIKETGRNGNFVEKNLPGCSWPGWQREGFLIFINHEGH
jgi:hypothetical protein